jgi:hypothetical protein
VAELSAQHLADLVPCPLEQVTRLVELAILAPSGSDGRFASSDVHVVRLMAAFDDAGITLEDVARGVSDGELSFPLGLFLPEPEELSATYAELAAGVARPPELLRRLSAELGLPPAADDRIRGEDAELLSTSERPASPRWSAASSPGSSVATASTRFWSTSSL